MDGEPFTRSTCVTYYMHSLNGRTTSSSLDNLVFKLDRSEKLQNRFKHALTKLKQVQFNAGHLDPCLFTQKIEHRDPLAVVGMRFLPGGWLELCHLRSS
jgi:hypothetical protein